ncbi:MAG: hypothetical protein H7175_00825 [Burkholderiales bacterium]|nr:hypothetical protein [Anaerolineae bacterium]
MKRQEQQEYFRLILSTVVGQAFAAAGYALEERPSQWAGGLYRFVKSLGDDLFGFIEFQHLSYTDSEWASNTSSRFRVTVQRSDVRHTTSDPRYIRRSLSALVVEDFGVAILPSADHWWSFRSTEELGKALAEAGHLIVGYGMPFLAGELTPPSAGS